MTQDELDEEENQIRTPFKTACVQRLYSCIVNCRKRKTGNKNYILDPVRLENLFYLLTNQYNLISEDTMKGRDATEEAMLFTIKPKGWFLIDALAAWFHVLMMILLTVPMLLLALLNEWAYSPFSLKDPRVLINSEDWQDPLAMLEILVRSSVWNVTICIIVFVFWMVLSIDLLIYYTKIEFPQHKSFEQAETKRLGFFEKNARRAQWLLALFVIFCYVSYICLMLIWLLLGAIINPTAFFASRNERSHLYCIRQDQV